MAHDENSCPICGFEQFQFQDRGSSREHTCECKRCGGYHTTREFLLFHHDEKYADRWHLLSGLIREINEGGETPEIMYQELDKLFADPRIPKDDDTEAKSKKILSYLKKHSSYFGDTVAIHLQSDRSTGYTRNDEEFDALIQMLNERCLLAGGFRRTRVDQGDFLNADGSVSLTDEGWKLAQNNTANPSDDSIDTPAVLPELDSADQLFDAMQLHSDIVRIFADPSAFS